MTIILENVCGYIPVVVVSTLIHNVCAAVLEAYRRKDGLILRQIVEFFIEWIKSSSSVLTGYNKYREQVESMLQVSLYFYNERKSQYLFPLRSSLVNFMIK